MWSNLDVLHCFIARVHDKRLHMQEITTEEIKGNNAPRYGPHVRCVTIRSRRRISEHERADVDHGKVRSSGAPMRQTTDRVE